MHLRWSYVVLLASAFAALVSGCAAEGAADTGSYVAVVPPGPVVETHDTYVTLDGPAASPAPTPPALAVVVVVAKPPDPGCIPDDDACLEAACNRGSALGCEARGDRYRDQDDVRALAFYRRALITYQRACAGGDTDACAGGRRLSTPGFGAHDYLAIRDDAPDPPSAPPPIGMSVVINGNHNVVQVFGSAAKVVGSKVAKKTKPERPAED